MTILSWEELKEVLFIGNALGGKYVKRLHRAYKQGLFKKFKKGGGVYPVSIVHDDWCRIYKQKPCNCDPWIKVYEYDPEKEEQVLIYDSTIQ